MKNILKILAFIILFFLSIIGIRKRNHLVYMKENILKNKNELVLYANKSITDIDYLNMRTIKIMKYNKNVQEYNSYLNTFPNILFKSIGYNEFDYYDNDEISLKIN